MSATWAAPVRRDRGYTLLEMLVVIVLIGVAMVLLGVGLGRGLHAAAERKALTQMVDTLRAARVMAVVSGQPTRAVFDLQQRTVQALGKQPVHWPADWQVRLQTSEQLGAAYAFYPDGGSSGGNVLISREARQWRIDVSWLTGTVVARELP
ncbi:GspH/FimT family pseudopilin [Pseudomonas sp. dw_358]|uniref:GspH/FimT family pseudopilin n=1 Tax=Pseudomonas sp. dw_358 TaxID=2720083 RepID=UPI001BD32C9D|nr:GspH/FimT family pseudopilin [Pseudomonas sp. dw_358]